jgi:hypothetical protein
MGKKGGIDTAILAKIAITAVVLAILAMAASAFIGKNNSAGEAMKKLLGLG